MGTMKQSEEDTVKVLELSENEEVFIERNREFVNSLIKENKRLKRDNFILSKMLKKSDRRYSNLKKRVGGEGKALLQKWQRY